MTADLLADGARTGADLVIECLQAEDVDLVAGVPGTTVMDLIDSLARQDSIRFVHTRHEQVAGFLADGVSRAGGLGVALVSRGPGAANAAIAVHNAYDESVPMVLLVGQVPESIVERRSFEEMDVVATFRPMTKWVVEIRSAARIPELLQRAVRTAVTGRPGPVVVSLPMDVLQEVVPDALVPAPRRRSALPAPDPDALVKAAALMASARRPVIIAGGGVRDAEAVARLAEAVAAPVITTWLRQDRVSADSPAFVGSLGYGAHEVTEHVVREADVMLALGCRFSEFSTKRWTLVPSDVRLIHVDVDPDELGRVYVPEVGLTADANRTALELAKLSPAPDTERTDRVDALREVWLSQSSMDSGALADDDPGAGVSSIHAVTALQSLLERDDVVVVQDAPSFGPWSHRYLRLSEPGRFFGSSGGAMAWGLPAGMGIALARPDRRVVTISGDGSFWMVAQDFETCVREEIRTVNIVMNNDSYGNTRDRQRSDHGGRYLGVFYGNPDFAEFARSLGGWGVRVGAGEDLLPALEAALAQDLPAVVEVVQDQMYGLPPGLLPPAAR